MAMTAAIGWVRGGSSGKLSQVRDSLSGGDGRGIRVPPDPRGLRRVRMARSLRRHRRQQI